MRRRVYRTVPQAEAVPLKMPSSPWVRSSRVPDGGHIGPAQLCREDQNANSMSEPPKDGAVLRTDCFRFRM
jgi:hypothetical protein